MKNLKILTRAIKKSYLNIERILCINTALFSYAAEQGYNAAVGLFSGNNIISKAALALFNVFLTKRSKPERFKDGAPLWGYGF